MALTNSRGLESALGRFLRDEVKKNPLDPCFGALAFLWIYWDKCGKQSYSPGIAIWDGDE